MKSRTKQNFILTGIMFAVFAAFTLLVKFVDVRSIGPAGSSVGFASANGSFFDLFGQNAVWDKLTDLCLLAALLSAACFAVLGFFQLIKRKSLFKVDCDLYALAGFYVLVAVFYLLFELIVINQRPVLVDGALEASYPSSHTLIVCSFMLAAIFQTEKRIRNKNLKTGLIVIFALIIVLTAIGRLLSGMHWLTDVLGGLVLGASLGMLYISVARVLEKA